MGPIGVTTLVGYIGGSVNGVILLSDLRFGWNYSGSLTPEVASTPEPSSLLLMLVGIGGLALLVSRRQVAHTSRLAA